MTWKPGTLRAFKWIDALATYEVDSPWFTLGRFGDGSWKTLYLAETDKGAMAEYFRRHPEFLEFQDDLIVSLYELELDVEGDCLDVRAEDGQLAAGISHDRLVSSEEDEVVRYAECRQLAREALEAELAGIAYPSAATAWPAWNLVLLGDPSKERWVCSARREIERPRLEASEVRPLP